MMQKELSLPSGSAGNPGARVLTMEMVQDLIGVPWERPCHPPDSYDCWEIILEVRRRMGIPVPDYVSREFRNDASLARLATDPDPSWRETDVVRAGTILSFGIPTRHVGIALTPRDVLHTSQRFGSRVDRLHLLALGAGGHRAWEYRYG